MRYSERLWAPWTWWLVVGAFAFSLVVAEAAWAPGPMALVLAVLVMGVTVWLMLAAGRTRVEVDDESIRVGRNRIEFCWVDRVRGCDAETMHTVMHSSKQAGSFLVTKPWISTGLVMRLCDPADPHQAWIISTRHPQRLAEVVRERLEAQNTGADPDPAGPRHSTAADRD